MKAPEARLVRDHLVAVANLGRRNMSDFKIPKGVMLSM